MALALAIVVFLVAVTLPYSWLIEHFGYDDILREPAAVILGNFQRGGAPLVAAWFGFAMASLLFVPVAIGFQRWLTAHAVDYRSVAVLGIASAIAQAVGLVGQLLLAGWTGGVALQLWRSRALPRWLAAAGALTLPLWLLGQTELLHPVLPTLPRVEVIPIAFMAWEAWLAAIAVALLSRFIVTRPKPSHRPPAADAR